MTSTVPDLPVPDEARCAFADQHGLTPPGSAGRRVDWDAVDRDIRAIAAPVLAAWVEQVASEWDDQRWSTTPRAMAKVLRDRLAELDPDA